MVLVPITLKVEEIAFIPVLRVLHATPGIANVHFDIDQIGNSRGNSRKARADQPASLFPESPPRQSPMRDLPRQLLIALLAQGPQHLAVLKKAVADQGLHMKSVDTMLNAMRQKGITESGGVGIHKLTEKAMAELASAPAALAAPDKPSESAAETPQRKSGKPIGSGINAIIALMQKTPGVPISTIALRKVITAAGLSPTSVGGRLSDAKRFGMIKRTGRATYELTAKGRQYKPTAE